REHLAGEAVRPVARVELLDAPAHGPSGPEARDVPRQLVAVDAIAARIRSAPLEVRDRAAGHDLLHHLRDLADLVVLAAAADVEGLVVNRLTRRLEHGEEGA